MIILFSLMKSVMIFIHAVVNVTPLTAELAHLRNVPRSNANTCLLYNFSSITEVLSPRFAINRLKCYQMNTTAPKSGVN